MTADTDFLDELILGLDTATLEWLALRIERVLKARHPEITARKIIIRKIEE
jgi:hypothetical protein